MISLVGWSPIWQEPKLDVRNVSVGNAIGTAGNDWQRSPEPVKNEVATLRVPEAFRRALNRGR